MPRVRSQWCPRVHPGLLVAHRVYLISPDDVVHIIARCSRLRPTAVTASRPWSAARPSVTLSTCRVGLFSCAPACHMVAFTLFSFAPADCRSFARHCHERCALPTTPFRRSRFRSGPRSCLCPAAARHVTSPSDTNLTVVPTRPLWNLIIGATALE